MRRSWLRSKRRQALGPGPARLRSEGLAFRDELTLVKLLSGGFEYRKREEGWAAFARPAEWVLGCGWRRRGSRKERLCRAGSNRSFSSTDFSAAKWRRSFGLSGPALLLWGAPYTRSLPGSDRGSERPGSHPAGLRSAHELRAGQHEYRWERSDRACGRTESCSHGPLLWFRHSSTKRRASGPGRADDVHRRLWPARPSESGSTNECTPLPGRHWLAPRS